MKMTKRGLPSSSILGKGGGIGRLDCTRPPDFFPFAFTTNNVLDILVTVCLFGVWGEKNRECLVIISPPFS